MTLPRSVKSLPENRAVSSAGGRALFLGVPWLLIGGSWIGWENAWLTTAVYHAWIGLVWWKTGPTRVPLFSGGHVGVFIGVALVCGACLPLIVTLWPWAARESVDMAETLVHLGLAGWSFWAFFAYLVTIHPFLEEVYWRGLLPQHLTTDLAFAGFHVFLTWTFLAPIWQIPVVVGLLIGAGLWRLAIRRFGGLLIPIGTHAVADAAILLAAWWLAR